LLDSLLQENIKKEVVVDDGIKDFDTSHEAKLA